MGIGRRIREARIAQHMTQEELARLLGVTKGAVANYENDTSHPKEQVLYRLFPILSVDANFLFQDMLDPAQLADMLTPAERAHLADYRRLSDYSRGTVDLLISRELSAQKIISFAEARPIAAASLLRPENVQSVSENAASARHGGKGASSASQNANSYDVPMYFYPYLHNIASAGGGTYADDIPSARIEAPFKAGADFIIGVNGSSMEPLYRDGDLLYVERTTSLAVGEIGIFSKDDSIYIKEVGADRLISRNPEFPDIYPDSGSITVVGKVLGVVPAAI